MIANDRNELSLVKRRMEAAFLFFLLLVGVLAIRLVFIQWVSAHAFGRIADNMQGQTFLSFLVGSFAVLAMLLAAVGIYGVLSYNVTQRTREIGIRMSLGASRGQVLGEVIGQGMRLAAVGFVIGLAGAIWAGRIMASLLHEVTPGDPTIFIGTIALLGLVALVACYLPARRAARMSPTLALRYE